MSRPNFINVTAVEFNRLYTHLQAAVALDLYVAEHGKRGPRYPELRAAYLKAYLEAFNYYDVEPKKGRPRTGDNKDRKRRKMVRV